VFLSLGALCLLLFQPTGLHYDDFTSYCVDRRGTCLGRDASSPARHGDDVRCAVQSPGSESTWTHGYAWHTRRVASTGRAASCCYGGLGGERDRVSEQRVYFIYPCQACVSTESIPAFTGLQAGGRASEPRGVARRVHKRANARLPDGRSCLDSCAVSSTVPGERPPVSVCAASSLCFHTYPTYTRPPPPPVCFCRPVCCPGPAPLLFNHTHTLSPRTQSHPGSGAERPLTRKTTRELGLSTLDLRSLQIPSLRQNNPPLSLSRSVPLFAALSSVDPAPAALLISSPTRYPSLTPPSTPLHPLWISTRCWREPTLPVRCLCLVSHAPVVPKTSPRLTRLCRCQHS
jgi:hypothetical protein